jgi:Kef-type K+ transport system membrane component KefB
LLGKEHAKAGNIGASPVSPVTPAAGGFIAGSLVAESGVETVVEHLVRPVRDIFAAIFFRRMERGFADVV